jgi:hypothetical protein
MTKKEAKFRFNLLSEYGCIICKSPAEIHHLLGIKYSGVGQKAKDEFTIPLCPNHHRGVDGIHQIGIKTWEAKFNTQEFYLEKINNWIKLNYG